jgi:diguanylate cyclase (GGDEF)-like protein
VRIATVRDVTLEKADRDRMLLQATHDELTGLPNRRLFDDRLDMTLRRAARTEELVAVAFLDVDRFKAINDSLGHAMGDRLLVALSRRLHASLRESDTVARMGGDEFIFILPGLHQPEDAQIPLRKLLEAVRAPVRLDEQELYVTASIGAAVFPTDGQEHDRLLRHADAALYRAKARGRNRFELFDHGLALQAATRVRLDADLRRADARGELRLVYQPQVNFRTGKVLGFEALMRWDHPQLGPVAPATFIPIAEETGLISSLGAWALERACRDLVAWDRTGMGPLRIAVNVSPRQLQHDDLVGQVERVLAHTGLAPGRLELEFTETALLLEDEAIGDAIHRLRALGVGLALDDFGTGYSSLSHLRQYPIQRLKMDRSFVQGITGDRGDAAVARAIIGLARELRLAVVAEGVETAEQLALLGSFGCEEAQGFHLGRPMPAHAVAGAYRLAA